MKIYTGTGDSGETDLFGEGRSAKDAPRVETYGTIDELNAVLGLARTETLPEAINGLLAKTGVKLDEVAKLVFPCLFKAELRNIGKRMGCVEKVADNMHEVCGETGAAHPLVMFINELQGAKPGDKMIMASC